MHLAFLVPLMTGVVSAYIFNKSADEMADLSGVVTIVSIILTLIFAPWQLQLLVLMAVMISTRRLLLQNEYKMGPQNKEKPEDLGIRY